MPSILEIGHYDFALTCTAVNAGAAVKFVLDQEVAQPLVEKRKSYTVDVSTSGGNRFISTGRGPLTWAITPLLQRDLILDNGTALVQSAQALRGFIQAFEAQNALTTITLTLPSDANNDRTFAVWFTDETEFLSLAGRPLVRARLALMQVA